MDWKQFRNLMVIALIIGLFLGLRWWRLDERMNFSMDQGLFSLRAYEIWQNREITLIGPPASPTVEGRQFFQGPIIYYSIIILGLLGGWDPIRMSGWFGGMVLGANLGLWGVLKKRINQRVAWIFLILMTFLPISINYSNFIWNPNFLLVITPLIISLVLIELTDKKMRWWFLIGVLAGLGGQYHYQFTLVWLVLIILSWIKTKSLKQVIWLLSGIILGWLPLIIFELRNNFYNINTIFQWLTESKGSKLIFQEYYYLWIVPLLMVGVAWGLAKIDRKWQLLIVGIVVVWGLVGVTYKRSVIGMPINWSYRDLVKTEKIIMTQVGNKFNVVNTLSGDSRFYPMRYLLTVDKKYPESVADYQTGDQLFVLARNEDGDMIEKSTLWEIGSFGGKITERWPINNQVSLFRLNK